FHRDFGRFHPDFRGFAHRISRVVAPSSQGLQEAGESGMGQGLQEEAGKGGTGQGLQEEAGEGGTGQQEDPGAERTQGARALTTAGRTQIERPGLDDKERRQGGRWCFVYSTRAEATHTLETEKLRRVRHVKSHDTQKIKRENAKRPVSNVGREYFRPARNVILILSTRISLISHLSFSAESRSQVEEPQILAASDSRVDDNFDDGDEPFLLDAVTKVEKDLGSSRPFFMDREDEEEEMRRCEEPEEPAVPSKKKRKALGKY
ncbi:Queuine tRNA-ribosyltransferase, partial [Frankliniella fusca]